MTVSFTGAAVTAFTAPKLAVGSTSIQLMLRLALTVSVKSIGHITSCRQCYYSRLNSYAQGTILVLDDMVKLATLDYTSTAIGGTLTASSTMVSLTTLTLGSDSKLTTLTVSATNMTALTTAGVILNTNIVQITQNLQL